MPSRCLRRLDAPLVCANLVCAHTKFPIFMILIINPPVVEPPAVKLPEKKTHCQRKRPQALAFERDAKRRRKQQTADDGKPDEPYDIDLHISKQSTPQGWIQDQISSDSTDHMSFTCVLHVLF